MKQSFSAIIVFFFLNTISLAQSGSLDITFGKNGKVLQSFGASNKCNTVTVLKSGKLLAAGKTSLAGYHTVALMRFYSDGKLDSSFGNYGQVALTIYPNDQTECLKVLELDNGKILALVDEQGVGDNNYAYNVVVVRFEPDGKIDSSFGKNGFVKTELGYNESCRDMQIDSNGRIVLAGRQIEFKGTSSINILLLRYGSNGSRDSTFGRGGIVITNINGNKTYEEANSMVLQSDGKIIIGGKIYSRDYSMPDAKFLLVRFLENGSIDSSFGSNGLTITQFSSNDDIINSISLMSNGNIIAAGTSYAQGDAPYYYQYSGIALAQYLPNGQPYTFFGKKGKLILQRTSTNTEGRVVLVQPDSKIIIACMQYKRNYKEAGNFLVMRLFKTGIIDSSFGNDGLAVADFGSREDALSAVLQADGKIVVAGPHYPVDYNEDEKFAIARFNGDSNQEIIAKALIR